MSSFYCKIQTDQSFPSNGSLYQDHILISFWIERCFQWWAHLQSREFGRDRYYKMPSTNKQSSIVQTVPALKFAIPGDINPNWWDPLLVVQTFPVIITKTSNSYYFGDAAYQAAYAWFGFYNGFFTHSRYFMQFFWKETAKTFNVTFSCHIDHMFCDGHDHVRKGSWSWPVS